MKLILLIFSLFLLIVGVVEGEYSCVSYNRSDLVSPCNLVNPSAFAYLDLSSTSLAAELAYMNNYIPGLQAIPDPTCRDWYTVWSCQEPKTSPPVREAMRSCAVDVFGEVVSPATFVPTCRDFCDSYFAACKPFVDAIGLGEFLPPDFCQQFTNDGILYQGQVIPCFNATPNLVNQSAVLNCPEGTVLYHGDRCRPTCPSPEYSSSQVFDIGLMQQIVSWISFVAVSVMLIFFVVIPSLRQFPNRIILFLLISTMPISLAFMLATFVGGNVGDVWCGDTTSFPNERIGGNTDVNPDIRSIASGGLCVFQAWLIVWGTLATGIWWLILILNTTLLIYRSSQFETNRIFTSGWREFIMHLFAWGVPTILVVIPTAASKMDYESTNVFCFISTANNQRWRIGCWFVPMGIIVVIGFIGVLVSIAIMIKHAHKSHQLTRLVIFRLGLSFFFILVTTTLFLAFLIFSSSELDGNLIDIYYYLVCLFVNSTAYCRTQLDNQTSLPTSYQLGMAATFFLAVLGAFLSLFFASSSAFLNSVKSSGKASGGSARTGSSVRSGSSAISSSAHRDIV